MAIAEYRDGEWFQAFQSEPLPAFNTLSSIEEHEYYWLFVESDGEVAYPVDLP